MPILEDLWIRRVRGTRTVAERSGADFLHIRTDSGTVGIWGPISPIQSLLVASILRQRLVNLPLGKARQALEAASDERHAAGHFAMACTACDLALWDIQGKERGVPVARLLGQPGRCAVPCYASLLGSDLLDPPPGDELMALAQTYWGLKWAARLGPAHGRLASCARCAPLRRSANVAFQG
jgi:L-alanine-DL-glutamate epimerase-like enolase superfamily enzyme